MISSTSTHVSVEIKQMSVKYKGSQNNTLCDCATYVGIVSQYELSAREECVTLHQITVSA